MESSGNPPRQGGVPEDDPPLPSWYRPPQEGGGPQSSDAEPPGAEPSGEPPRQAEPPPPPPAQPPPTLPPSGDTAPLAAEGAAAAPSEELPPWSRARETPPEPGTPPLGAPPGGTPPRGDTAPLAAEGAAVTAAGLPPTAVADAWSTQPEQAGARPSWALHPRRDHPHVFGDRMAAGVLLTLAAGSMIAGGIYALAIGDVDTTIRAAICGAVAAVLLAASVALRLLRGSDDLRGTLAVTGIAFAAACIVFAYNPANPDNHDLLIKAVLAAGVVTVLCWFAAIVVPSAVAGFIGVVALATAVGAAVWLGIEQPTHLEVFVAAIGVGLALALVLPRLVLLRPHPAGLGWALGGAALVVALPAVELMAHRDGISIAAGATASAAMLAVAQRHRHLPAALAAFVGLGYLEALLVTTRTGVENNDFGTTQLIIVVAVGVVLAIVVAVGAVLQARSRPAALPRRRIPGAGIADVLLLAALVLSVLTLFIGSNTDVPLTPNQLQPGSTATHVTTTLPGS